MKRHTLLILALFLFAHIRAQVEIIKDVQSDTQRDIITSSIPILEFKKSGSVPIFMHYVQTYGNNPRHLWLLGFEITTLTRDEMQAGMKLLIKCSDGTIIESRLAYDVPEEAFISKPLMGTVFYHISPLYILTEDELNHIASHNIVKIRIESPWNRWGYFDLPGEDVKPWKPSEAITSLFIALKTRLRAVPDNSIYNDF